MYAVTAFRQGCFIATLTLMAADAWTAIEQAEQELRLKAREYHISEGPDETRLVEWTGVDFEARKISEERIER